MGSASRDPVYAAIQKVNPRAFPDQSPLEGLLAVASRSRLLSKVVQSLQIALAVVRWHASSVSRFGKLARETGKFVNAVLGHYPALREPLLITYSSNTHLCVGRQVCNGVDRVSRPSV
jgi:hypothetical protein